MVLREKRRIIRKRDERMRKVYLLFSNSAVNARPAIRQTP
jgi:hypothetical protein